MEEISHQAAGICVLVDAVQAVMLKGGIVTDFEIFKALAGLASALGAIAVYKYNNAQARKVQAELVEKFELALEKRQKHAATELFRLLHGLRMEFDDVSAICKHNKAPKIILALQKTPGMVKFEGGLFEYTELFERKWVRSSSRWVARGLAYLFGALTVLFIGLMATLDGASSLAMLIFVIPCAAFLAMQLKDIRYDNMVESIVSEPNQEAMQRAKQAVDVESSVGENAK